MTGFPEPAVGGSAEQVYRFLDTLSYIRVSGDDTDGRVSVVEMRLREGHAPPMHSHADADETIHVLDGEVTAHTPTTTHTAGPGESIVLPSDEQHSLLADTQAHVIVTTTPAGFGQFIKTVGEPTDDETVPTDPPERAAMETVAEVAPQYGIEITGPPPTQK